MAMNYTQDITLDLNSNSAYTVVDAKQGDVNSRVLHVTYTQNGAPYLVNTNNSVALRFRKPDGHVALNDATINYDGTVTVTFTYQCLVVSGRGYADLVEFNSSGQVLSTVSFIVNIMPQPNWSADDALSSDEFLYLKSFLDRGNYVIGEAQEWANGYNGDTPVTSDNPAYNNHSKYWKEQAQLEGEAWALGTKNGAAIPSSHPAYNNYSKYWSQDAEAWARGKRGGAAVASSDPTYNDNSEYWKEQSRLEGEAWSRGTKDGAAIPSTHPAYNNNSKYWSEQSALNGEAFANGTRDGAAIPSTDPAYKKNSKYYADTINNMTTTGHNVSSSTEVRVEKSIVDDHVHLDFYMAQADAIFVMFEVDTTDGQLYIHRPESTTLEDDLGFSIDAATGELKVDFEEIFT